jgi:hypothetical protein
LSLADETPTFGAQLDNIISAKVYNLGERKLKSAGNFTNQSTSLISDHAAAVEYGYGYTRERGHYLLNGLPSSVVATTDQHIVTPSLYWEFSPNFPVTVGFSYSRLERHRLDLPIPGSAGTIIDQYTPFISAHAELLHFFSGLDTQRTALFFGGNFSYTRADFYVTHFVLSSDTYDITPSFIFIHSLLDWSDGTPGHLSVTLSPAYDYAYTDYHSPVSHSSIRHGMVTVLGRLDYGLTQNFYLNAAATWLHDANEAPANGFYDWAVFGAGLTWRVAQTDSSAWLLKISYAYQAFYPETDTHSVSARVEWHF